MGICLICKGNLVLLDQTTTPMANAADKPAEFKKVEQKEKICANDACNVRFTYKRNSKKYCSGNCRKRATEVTQNRFVSNSVKRRHLEYWDRVTFAIVDLIKMPPRERAAWLQAYIDNETTARIVGNPKLLRDTENNIAKVANRFTQRVYRVSIKTYLRLIRDNPEKDVLLYDYSVFEDGVGSDIILGEQPLPPQ